MKKNLTKKLMLSVLTLAFAVVSLGASTFAWFTMSGKADVEAFQGTVKASEGIEVGYSPINANASSITWKTDTITATEISELIAEINTGSKTGAWKFDAVTPSAPLGFTKDDSGKVTTFNYGFKTVAGSSAKGNTEKASNGTYVAFALHFKLSDNSTTKTFDLLMDEYKLENKSSSALLNWNADTVIKLANGDCKVGDTVKYDVRSAARVALWAKDSDNVEGFNEVNEYLVDGTESTKGYSFDGKNAKGALQLYNAKMNEDLEWEDIPAVEDKQETTDVNEAAEAVLCAPVSDANNQVRQDLAAGTTVKIGTLTAGKVITLNVVVWIEGWDAECLNTLFSQILALDLGFKIPEQE